MTAEHVIELLGLQPHPEEGGYFVETYRSPEPIRLRHLPPRYPSQRCIGTGIYYLLTDSSFSAMHRLLSDEVFHFYMGDPVEMLQLMPDGSGQVVTLGTDLAAGMRPQIVVAHGVWQGSRVVKGGKWALLGTTVAPGFDFQDYEGGRRADLLRDYPGFRGQIEALTRE
jgi:predicted cupin superfamily sugar epimerase